MNHQTKYLSLVGIAILVLICPKGFACLEETQSEIEARYGRPFSKYENDPPNFVMYAYRYKEFNVFVWFEGGRSQNESYFHVDRKSELSESEIEVIMRSNCRDEKWEDTAQSNVWELPKSKAFAIYHPKHVPPFFEVFTARYQRLAEERK